MKQSSKIIIDQDQLAKKRTYHIVKRIFDLIASLCGLIILSPLFLVVALLIKCEDHGPVFYKQKRVGKDQREFDMFKFRSMHVDADKRLTELKEQNEVDGPMFKMKNDPRITSVGRFLRKTSLDELPQLWNVLRGDMSLVGPRPPLPREVANYSKYDLQRLWVIPGITGLWQATERNNVGFEEMVELDLEYIKKRSLLFDAKIILLTIIAIIHPNGAY